MITSNYSNMLDFRKGINVNQFHFWGLFRGRFRKCRDNSSCFRENVSSTAQQQFPERDPRNNFLRLGGNL